MVRKQGDRLKQSETKSNIIKYILEYSGSVGEPDIRKHLEEKYKIKDQGNINRHLHELKKNGYIEFIPPSKTGLRNEWNITKIEHLKNIRDKFKGIKLNEHEKSLSIILQENKIEPDTDEYCEVREMLRHSKTFFEMFLEYSKEELERKTRAYFYEKIRKKQYPNLINGTKDQLEALFNNSWYYPLFEYCYETDIFNNSAIGEYKIFTEEKLNYWFAVPPNELAPYISFHDTTAFKK